MLFHLFEMLFPLNLSTNISSSGKAFLSLKLCQAVLLGVSASILYAAHHCLHLGICVAICLVSAFHRRTKAPGGQKLCLSPQLDACLPTQSLAHNWHSVFAERMEDRLGKEKYSSGFRAKTLLRLIGRKKVDFISNMQTYVQM